MKRLAILLGFALALSLALVAVAAAAPPSDFCDTRPDHPKCSTNTTITEPPVIEACETVTVIDTTGRVRFECDWTPGVSAVTNGTVRVRTIGGEVTQLTVFVRDSSPGDICKLEQWGKPVGDDVAASVPLAYQDLDGIWETYWDNKTHWCSRFDPVTGERPDWNGDPLHLRIDLRGKKGTTVEVSLTPEQAS